MHNIATIAHEPSDIPALFVRAWNNRQAENIAALFEENADFINVVGIWWEDREAIYEAHEYGLKVIFSESTLRLGRVKTKMLNEDIAVVHARMRLDGQKSPDGKSTGIRHNLFIFVVRRQGDHWLALSAQNTDIVIGAETHIRRADGTLLSTTYRRQDE